MNPIQRLLCFVLITLVCFGSVRAQAINWQQTNGPYGGVIRCFATSGNSIFAGTQGSGIFRSTDNGANWTPINSGITHLFVSALAASGNSIFAGTLGGGVFRSNDNGINWTSVNSGITNFRILALTVSGNSLFAGTSWGSVFRAENAITSIHTTEPPTSPHLYPNPASELTTIEFDVPQPQPVRASVLNSLGIEVKQLASDEILSGRQRLVWETQGMASGVYTVRIIAGGVVSARNVVVVR